MKIRLRTLTPLWTGGVDGTMDRIHEAGIIGSMRWWYEAIVRGLGGWACNPRESGCSFDVEKYRQSKAADERRRLRDAGLCDVCQVFGATGRQRQFRVLLGKGNPLFDNPDSIPLPSGRVHQARKGPRVGGWYLMGKSIMGTDISLQIIPIKTQDVSNHLRLVLSLIDRHAAIGAKVSQGYGVVKLSEQGEAIRTQWPNTLLQSQTPPRDQALPDIRDFFFAKLRFQAPQSNMSWWQRVEGIRQALEGQVIDSAGNPVSVFFRNNAQRNEQLRQQAKARLADLVQAGLLPLAPAVRNWLRYRWNNGLSKCQKYFLFGEARPVCPHCCQPGFRPDKEDQHRNWCPNCQKTFARGKEYPRAASKINISYAYRLDGDDWEFRIWGWIPCNLPESIHLDRDRFLHDLKSVLGREHIWRQVFGASNHIKPIMEEWHSLDCDQRDGIAYLETLLGIGEDNR